MRRPLPAASALAILLIAAAPVLGARGADITITGFVPGNAYGNGTPPLGAWPWLSPDDNAVGYSLMVEGGGIVDIYAFGGYASAPADAAHAGQNSVTLTGDGEVGEYAVGGAAALSGPGLATATGNFSFAYDTALVGKQFIGGHASADDDGTGLSRAEARDNMAVFADNASLSPLSAMQAIGGWAEILDSLGLGRGDALASGNQLEALDAADLASAAAYGGLATTFTGSAEAEGNRILFGGSARTGVAIGQAARVFGAGDALAQDARTQVKDNAVVDDFYLGGEATALAGDATAAGNQAQLAGNARAMGAGITGGLADSTASGNASATDNHVSVQDGSQAAAATGGQAKSNVGAAWAGQNLVYVGLPGQADTAMVFGMAQGGIARSAVSGDATAQANSVYTGGYAEVQGLILGGLADAYSGTASALGNSVVMSDDTVAWAVTAGMASNYEGESRAEGNWAWLRHGSWAVRTVGGMATVDQGDAWALGNSVYLNDDAVSAEEVTGALAVAESGTAFAGGTGVWLADRTQVHGDVRGGVAQSGAGLALAEQTEVALTDDFSMTGTLTGVSVTGVAGARASGIQVEVADNAQVGQGVVGAVILSSSGDALGQDVVVLLSGQAAVYGQIMGVQAAAPDGRAEALDNLVSLEGATAGPAAPGGRNAVAAAVVMAGQGALAVGNTLEVVDSRVAADALMAGSAFSQDGDAEARDNTVVLSGGSFAGASDPLMTGAVDIVGGLAAIPLGSGGQAAATGNLVALDNRPGLAGAYLWGGLEMAASGADSWFLGYGGGNRLEASLAGNLVSGLAGFQEFYFLVPPDFDVAADAMLTVASAGLESNLVDSGAGLPLIAPGTAVIGGAAVEMAFAGAAPALEAGDRIVLIDAETLSGTPDYDPDTDLLRVHDGFRQYEFDLVWDDPGHPDQLYALFRGFSFNDGIKALAEGRLAGLAFAHYGTELVSGQAMLLARREARLAGGRPALFAATRGGVDRFKTGSHVRIAGVELLTGLSRDFRPAPGMEGLLLGAFFEAGWGHYRSYNDFGGLPPVRGRGDADYYGGGLLARADWTNGLYAEASFRAGRTGVDFRSWDLGSPAEYRSRTAYLGGHIGLGHVAGFGAACELDLHAKFLWTRQGSDTVMALGQPVRFASAASQRLRLGARYTFGCPESRFRPFAGAAFEYETDGKAWAWTSGYAIPVPSLRGGYAVGEAGFTSRPRGDRGFFAEAGAQGYAGRRRGVSGLVRFGWQF